MTPEALARVLRERIAQKILLGKEAKGVSGMNEPSIVRMFHAMAERVEAGEPWRDVLKDYGMSFDKDIAPPPPEPEWEWVEREWEQWAEAQPEVKAGRPLIATATAFHAAYRLGYAAALARARGK